MATGTVEMAINAMTKYANVRWYAFGETDPGTNQIGRLTKMGEKLEYAEGAETVHLAGANHFVYKEMMNALYDELIEKKNLKGDYDLILLEFDGDLLCREGVAPYQLNYDLPEGWDDEKAAQLRVVMEGATVKLTVEGLSETADYFVMQGATPNGVKAQLPTSVEGGVLKVAKPGDGTMFFRVIGARKFK